MKKLNFNNVINLTLFLYILSLYFFTYQVRLNLVSNGLALTLICMIWINSFFLKKKITFNRFLKVYLLFIIISIGSVFFAIDASLAIGKTKTLILLFIFMVSLINYIDTLDKLEKSMKYFALSGFIASGYILLNADFSNLTRYGSELGNVNAIGMIIGISSVFCFYFILERKNYIFIPMLLINISIIILTGSRKSLLFIVFALITLVVSKREKKIGSRFKIIILGGIIVFLSLYLVFNIPIFYEVIGKRMENLFYFTSGKGTSEGSLNIRFYMIQSGWQWFKDRPFTGYGIDNYRVLFGRFEGIYTYSHNNVIELLVGLGFLGAIVYYLTNIIVLKDLIKSSKLLSKPLTYSFISIILGYILMSVGLIYYDSKHISIILALGSVLYRIGKKDDEVCTSNVKKEKAKNEE